MWGPNFRGKRRPLTDEETQLIACSMATVAAKVLSAIPYRMDIPLMGSIGPFDVGETVMFPLGALEVLTHENVVAPLLPYWLRPDEMKKLSTAERASTSLNPLPSPWFLEITEFFVQKNDADAWLMDIPSRTDEIGTQGNCKKLETQARNERRTALDAYHVLVVSRRDKLQRIRLGEPPEDYMIDFSRATIREVKWLRTGRKLCSERLAMARHNSLGIGGTEQIFASIAVDPGSLGGSVFKLQDDAVERFKAVDVVWKDLEWNNDKAQIQCERIANMFAERLVDN